MSRPDPPTQTTKQPGVTAVTAPARDLAADLRRIVSEHTGYSPEMLSFDLDLEGDLGIDSIQRVQILGAFQHMFSDAQPHALSAIADTLFRARTLREIVTAAQAALGGAVAATEDRPDSQDAVEMVRKATEVLGTNHVARWMRSKIPSLGNQTPYSLMQTEGGRKQIERVLLKIEHGVY